MVNLTWFSWINNGLSGGELPRLSAIIVPRFGWPLCPGERLTGNLRTHTDDPLVLLQSWDLGRRR